MGRNVPEFSCALAVFVPSVGHHQATDSEEGPGPEARDGEVALFFEGECWLATVFFAGSALTICNERSLVACPSVDSASFTPPPSAEGYFVVSSRFGIRSEVR